jgi:hypothetical protein
MRLLDPGWVFGNYARLMGMVAKAHDRNAGEPVPGNWLEEMNRHLAAAHAICHAIGLIESRDYISRVKNKTIHPDWREAHLTLLHLVQLMESELDKRSIFVIDVDKSRYFLPESVPALSNLVKSELLRPKCSADLFGERVEQAFPSARSDIVEAGRCLALNRNNAAVYHLVRVAEVGLRALAWDRRVQPRNRIGNPLPLELSEWGKLISLVEGKIKEIQNWRASLVREEAHQFYNRAIVELRAFNDGWRRHVMHSRSHEFKNDEALALWGHVMRFMQSISDKISESGRTPIVWKKKPM